MSVAGTSRSPRSTLSTEELRRRRRARDALHVGRSAASLDSEVDAGDAQRLDRRTCSSSLRDPIRHADDVHGHLGGEAPHLGLRPPPVGHIPALSRPKELAHRLPSPRPPRGHELRLTPCARDCGFRCSRSLPSRAWLRDWPPRRRSGVGTESSCGISSAGVSRSGASPIRGSPWRRSQLPPSR
jgi:hypothetical protein